MAEVEALGMIRQSSTCYLTFSHVIALRVHGSRSQGQGDKAWPVSMSWRMGHEVTPLGAAMRRRSPRPGGFQAQARDSTPASLETPVGQSLDDMIEEIRRLRANVLPRGLHPEVLQSDAMEEDWRQSSPLSSSSGRRLPDLSTSKWLTPSPPSGPSASAPSRGPRPPTEPLVAEVARPFRASSPLRLTLWEERQLQRCLRAWSGITTSVVPAKELAPAFKGAEGPAPTPPAQTRLDRVWHAWRRLVASDRAGEIELSVQLLREQMARTQRGSLEHWRRWAERAPGRNDRRRFRDCRRRLAIHRWRRRCLERQQRWALADQASALLRVCALRRALRSLAKGLGGSRAKDEDTRRKKRLSLENAQLRRQLSSGFQWWLSSASGSRREAAACVALRRFAARRALYRLQSNLRDSKEMQLAETLGQMQSKGSTRRRAIRRWSRWCRKRQQRRLLLRGHLQNYSRPRSLRRCFLGWASHAREEQRNQVTLQKAQIILDLSLKSRTFHSWWGRWQLVFKGVLLLRGLGRALDSELLRGFLAEWRASLQRLQQERVVLHGLFESLRRRLQRGAVRSLTDFAVTKRRHGEVSAAIAERQRRFLQAAALRAWRDRHRAGREATSKLRGLHDGLRSDFISTLLASWKLTARQLREARAAIEILARGMGKMRQAGALSRLRGFHLERLKEERLLVAEEAVQAIRRRRLWHFSLGRWIHLFDAVRYRRHQQTTGLIGRSWRAWLQVVQEALELATLRVARGMTRRLSLLLRAGFECWCTAVQRGREFRTLVPVLLESVSDVFDAHALRSEWWAWQQWWCHVGECRAADTEELLLSCLRAWRQSSVEQRHKRGVHLLCERYRHTRTKRKVLHFWQRRLKQLSLIIQSVHLWTASRATLWAQTVAMAWHGCVVRRRRSQVAAIRLLWQRRARLLSSWRLLLLRRLAGQGVAEAVLLSRALRWIRAWRLWAFSHARKREADEVKATFVRQSRQRWWVERWCSVCRLNRLVDVAEKWDGQVVCRQLVRRAFRGWSALMGLYACAEKATTRVGELRMSRMLRLWSFLLRVGEKRPHQIMRSTLASWAAARSRNTEVRQGLYRLGRWTMKPVFQQWLLYLRDRRRRQGLVGSGRNRMEASAKSREQRSALKWWHHVASEVRREQRKDAANAPSAERDNERHEQVLRVRRREFLHHWREALLFKRARMWQLQRPRLVMDITGQTILASSFLVLAQRARQRRAARKAQEKVRSMCDRSSLMRSFDEWAKVYEHESSSFFASRLLDRWKLSRILERWKQHTVFRAGFASHVNQKADSTKLQRLASCMAAWKERLQLRQLVAGMWLGRRRAWNAALFLAWKSQANKVAEQRRQLRRLYRATKFRKASRGAKQQRTIVDARMVGQFFRAYAAWVAQARVLQGRASALGKEVAVQRRRRRLGAWAAHGRAFFAASKSAADAFREWVAQARRQKCLIWASQTLVSEQTLRAWRYGLHKLRAWCNLRRGLKAIIAGGGISMLRQALNCWVAAMGPTRWAALILSVACDSSLKTKPWGAMDSLSLSSFITQNMSLSSYLGLPAYTFRRILLLVSCLLGVIQYGLVLTNGVSVSDFNDYYGLTEVQGKFLYSCLNFGACALSFIPGCVPTMMLGTLIADFGIILQLVWTPDFPSFVSTMGGLSFCYICFGFAATFFNVIGSFAPLSVFPVQYVGQVSACVQVCMSLGMTIQTQAYYALKKSGGDPIMRYLIYAIITFNVVGVLMCVVFWLCRNLMEQAAEEEAEAEDGRSLWSSLKTSEFAYMMVLFCVAIGFSFSFLDCEGSLASEVNVSSKELASVFGIVNAFGRLAVCIPLDWTRKHRWGGVYSYILASLIVYTLGMLLLAIPSSPDAGTVRIANSLASFGYGGLLGIVPPALRLTFGTTHLGVIYGILYVAVAIFEPIWSFLFKKPEACEGVECYRLYTRRG
eukprot:s1197_g9.t1